MIKFPAPANKKEKDSTVALINIVFLMLVFFLIAGTIVPPIDSAVSPIQSQEDQTAQLDNTLSIRADGQTYYQGKPIEVEAFLAEFARNLDAPNDPVRILADQKLPAVTLVDTVNRVKAAGAFAVRLVTERSAE